MTEPAEVPACAGCGEPVDECRCRCAYCGSSEECTCAVGYGAATGG